MAGAARSALGRDRYAAAAVARVLPARLQRRHRRGAPAGAAPRVRDRSQPRARRASAPPMPPSRSATAFRPPAGCRNRSSTTKRGRARRVARGVLGVDGGRAAVPHRACSSTCRNRCWRRWCWPRSQSMFKVDELRQLLRVSKGEFLIALVTIAAVLGPRHPEGRAGRVRLLAGDADPAPRRCPSACCSAASRAPITSSR